MISQLNNLLVKMTSNQEEYFLKKINLAEPFIKKIINEGNSEEFKLINDYIINFFDISNYTYKTIKLTKHSGKQSIFRLTIKYLIKTIPFTSKYYTSREAYLVHLKNRSE